MSFHVRKGEILGVAGLDGSGRTETAGEHLRHRDAQGRHDHTGRQGWSQTQTPRESIKNGFALLTEERRATGIFGILNIRENTVISSLKKYQGRPVPQRQEDGRGYGQRPLTPCASRRRARRPRSSTLSGGNQQKVILGRWLLTEPEVLLLDEPTRGIDVGAKYEIYQLIQDLAKQGKAVVMVSSEMPELLGVCNRIVVMSGGRVAGEVDADNTTQEEIMTLAAKYA